MEITKSEAVIKALTWGNYVAQAREEPSDIATPMADLGRALAERHHLDREEVMYYASKPEEAERWAVQIIDESAIDRNMLRTCVYVLGMVGEMERERIRETKDAVLVHIAGTDLRFSLPMHVAMGRPPGGIITLPDDRGSLEEE